MAPGSRAPVSCNSRGPWDSLPDSHVLAGPRASLRLLTACVCVLSTPAPLGPLRKVRLWHDSRGASPAWYLSHVMVQELCTGRGRGRGWFFPAECWLAAGRKDGSVERELACLHRGLGFRKVGGTLSLRGHRQDTAPGSPRAWCWHSPSSRAWRCLGQPLPGTARSWPVSPGCVSVTLCL